MSNIIKNKNFFPAKYTAKRVEKTSYRLENVFKRYLTKNKRKEKKHNKKEKNSKNINK